MTKEYEFTLKYKLPGQEYDADKLAAELYENGCDDALIGIGVAGKIALEFVREATSAEVAILSAHQDVLNLLPEATLIEAMPDYVGLTDIAEIVAVSRQQVRKLYENNAGFPAPLHEGKSGLWHLAETLNWIEQNKSYSFDPLIMEVAKINLELNLASRAKPSSTKLISNYTSNSQVIKEYLVTTSATFSAKQALSSTAEVA